MEHLQLAERLFGAATHQVLVDDHGPAISVMGWRLGSAHVDCSEGDGAMRRVTFELLYSEAKEYAITERVQLTLANGATRLEASVTRLSSPKDVLRGRGRSRARHGARRDARP
jgi:hypothetical protein